MLVPSDVYERMRQSVDSNKTSTHSANTTTRISNDVHPTNKVDQHRASNNSQQSDPQTDTTDESQGVLRNDTDDTSQSDNHDAGVADVNGGSLGAYEPQEIAAKIPKRCRQRALKLMHILQKASLRWDSTGQIYSEDGVPMPETDIASVIRQLVSPRTVKNTPGEAYVRDIINRLNSGQKLLYKAKPCNAKKQDAKSAHKDHNRHSADTGRSTMQTNGLGVSELDQRDTPLSNMPTLHSWLNASDNTSDGQKAKKRHWVSLYNGKAVKKVKK